ncbi:RNA 2',3'-cyclic phosphodiesterase [Craterilacuibacter sp.]|uniref:RNA 2',3'-cyclic phosphodiesterase n=1 Tax=Craterilacuibacter sp. TaxID=2870909 RepID=UPI003F309811
MPTASATYRLFFAVWPDVPCARWLDEQVEYLHDHYGGRQTPPRQHHLTLAFVGEVAHSQLAAIEAIGQQAASQAESCRLKLDKLAVWPSGIGCAAPTRTPSRISELVSALNTALKAQGLPYEERRFRPHVTLLRKATPSETIPAAPDSFALLKVDHLSLVVSRLTRSGPLYQELRRWPLSGEDALS